MDDATQKLYEMCRNIDFSVEEAERLIAKVDVNKEVREDGRFGHITFLLYEAAFYQNIRMVKLLLEKGADPNLVVDGECALWEMQYRVYMDEMYEKEPEVAMKAARLNLQIAQLLLEYGADTNIAPEGEELFSYVLDMVFEGIDESSRWSLEHRSRFLILLVAYGGQSEYCKPEILIPFDKSNMEQYEFAFVKCPDNYHFTGEILDAEYNVVARV